MGHARFVSKREESPKSESEKGNPGEEKRRKEV
jgi:hypothetical protein